MLLTEGWDCPDVDCIIVLRPTKSRGLYTQMVGRGTRLAEGKTKLLLLDFLWMTGRHDLCRPATLLGTSDEVAARVTEMVEDAIEDGAAIDLLDAEPQAESDVQAQREAKLAEELEKMRHRKAKLVDPLQYAVSICDLDLSTYEPEFAWEMKSPTQKQVELLERRGIDTDGMTAGMASKMLDTLLRRQDEGMATPKQVRMLERKGFRHPGTWTFDQATKMMTILAKNRWIVPAWINPETYDPRHTDES
jgi:type I site-specific restriction endonuclease